MRWERLGRIFASNGQRPWMRSHAQVPIAEHLKDDVFRIYFTTRDAFNRSQVAWLEIDIREPNRILRLSEQPLLSPGKTGAFDESGTMGAWLVSTQGERRLYYIGWAVPRTVPFHNAIGLAIGPADSDPPVLNRFSDGPIIERNCQDPYFCANNCVLLESGLWKMWYVSGTAWEQHEASLKAHYLVRYAESADGVYWTRSGGNCLRYEHDDEIAITRPSVLRDGSIYKMWYCWRGRSYSYRLGYAESSDGINWTRLDSAAGLSASAEGWDSEMICYPFVFDHKGSRYMLYCGNGFSQAGFGLAVLS